MGQRAGPAHQGAAPAGRGLRGRAVWVFLDQALSSLANAALSVLVAKATGAEGYGAFAVAFTVYTFLLGISRALANQPFAMRCSGLTGPRATSESRGAAGAAVVFAVPCALVAAPVAVLAGGVAGPSVAAVAVLLPGLFLQDVLRSVLISTARPRAAAGNDALWALLQFTALGAAVAAGAREPHALVAIWALSGWVAAGAAVRRARAAPSPGAGLGFLRRHRDISGYLTAEWVTVQGSVQVALLLVGVLGEISDVGSLRAALTLLGPPTLLVVVTFGFLIPELARRPWLSRQRLRLVALAASGAITVCTLAWGLGLLVLPEWIGQALLGEVWPGARSTLLAITLCMVGAALSAGPLTVIRSCGEARPSFVVNVLTGVLFLVLTPAGFLLGGAPGAAAGFAVANLVPAPLFWAQMEVVLARRRSEAAEASEAKA